MNDILKMCNHIIENATIREDAKALGVTLTKTTYRLKQKAFAAIAAGKKRPYVLWIEKQKVYCSCNDYIFNKRKMSNETGKIKACKHLLALATYALVKNTINS